MTTLAQADDKPLPDFPYTPAELRRITAGVINEAYPPVARTEVGAAVRQDGPLWTGNAAA